MKFLSLLVAVLVLSGCAASSGTSAPVAAKAAAESKAPVVKNPLASGANKTACRASRREVAKRTGVFAEFSKGLATVGDAEAAAKKLQSEIGDTASYSEGAIGVQMQGLADAYGRMRVGLSTQDMGALGQSVKEQNAALGKLNALCASIGE